MKDSTLVERHQSISLIFEVTNAIKYLRCGLAEIQKINGANDFYEPLLMHLSTGFERLFKSMLCLDFKEKHDRFPSFAELMNGRKGHDLVYLKKQVEGLCIRLTQPIWAEDYDAITRNELIDRIFKVLSEYGSGGRYFNLDAVMGRTDRFDAKGEWEKIESDLSRKYHGQEQYFKILEGPRSLDDLYNTSSFLIVCELERFIAAITRQFPFGNFSKDAKTFWTIVDDFSDLEEETIGKTDYRLIQYHERIDR